MNEAIELKAFLMMFEKNPLSHAVVDRDMKIVLVNDAFCKMVGYSRDRLMGMKLTDFRTQGMIKYLKDTGESVTDALNQRRTTVGESTLDTPSGIHVVIRTNIPILDESGVLTHMYVTYNEITSVVKTQQYMAHEITELQKIYAIMAKGDLTPRYEITRPDEDTRETYELIILLRDAVRGIIGALQTNIRDINSRMLDLTANAESVTHSIEDASQGIQQIAHNAGQVSEVAERSAHSVGEIQKAMADMSAAIQEITSNMEQVSTLSHESNELSQKGAMLAGDAENSMKEISRSAEATFVIVSDVEKQMREISKIVVLIRDLANQTNLLALNAAIEAARAGDAGRGFAVVATEVKSLAQESKNSAERIEEMITTLTKSTQDASKAMVEAKGIVEKGSQIVSETFNAFTSIAASIEKVAKSASDVAAATEEQAATTEEITASIHEVASLVEQSAKEATGAAAATEQSSAAIDEITRMIQNANKTAAEAMEANRKFKVD